MRNPNSSEYRRSYYRKRKNEILNLLGNKCVNCGNVNNLEIDHINSFLKNFDITTKLMHKSKDEINKELQNCQLLCHNCHVEKSKKDISKKLAGINNPFYDKHGKDFPTSKPVIDLDTGKEYESATEFAREFNLNPNCVTRVCRGDRQSIKGHHVKYK